MKKTNQNLVGHLKKITLGSWHGYCAVDFNLYEVWDRLLEHFKASPPFYSKREWRKVYQIPIQPDGRLIYAKVIDEAANEKTNFFQRFYTTDPLIHLKWHQCLTKMDIPTPKILAVLGQRSRLQWVKSMLITEDFVGFKTLYESLSDLSEPDDSAEARTAIIEKLAHFTAQMHQRGIYFSLGSNNVMVSTAKGNSTNGDITIGLIDLDHFKKSLFGVVPERRRLRNLRRFNNSKSTLNQIDFNLFEDCYGAAMRS